MDGTLTAGESHRIDSRRFEVEALPWLDDVYRFALSMTRDESDADDVVQETFLRAYRSWHTFEPGSECRKWLFTICRNVFLRLRERERRRVDYGGDDAQLEALASGQEIVGSIGEHTDILSHVDLAPALERAIGELPEVFRSAVVLVDVEGMAYNEAASVLGVPVGTIRSRLFRGRRLLQESLVMFARDAGLPTRAACEV